MAASETTKKRALPPRYFTVAIILMLAIGFLAPGPAFIPYPWTLLGAVPILFGLGIAMWGDRRFAKVGTTIKPFQESSVLVTNGPFAISRNPMYLGMVLVLIGIGVLFGTAWPFAVIPVFAILIDRIFIRVEQRMMEARFGDDYRAYRQRVRRWI